ncbi:hypothetical protein HJC23_004275 [Cyclotella cryptica]|uniref:Uncharacterized protein n=1 Tax=Cyclotella cryptica TaxID=29204 RepID=A0ABD3Q3R6_9STRA
MSESPKILGVNPSDSDASMTCATKLLQEPCFGRLHVSLFWAYTRHLAIGWFLLETQFHGREYHLRLLRYSLPLVALEIFVAPFHFS